MAHITSYGGVIRPRARSDSDPEPTSVKRARNHVIGAGSGRIIVAFGVGGPCRDRDHEEADRRVMGIVSPARFVLLPASERNIH